MSSSGYQHKRHRDNADSPFRYGKKSMTNHPVLKMPPSHQGSELKRQDAHVPERTKTARPSSQTKPAATRHLDTASIAKQTPDPSSHRPRKTNYPYAEKSTEEHGTEEHLDGHDQYVQRPVTAAEWNRVYQRHAQFETPFSDVTLDMMHTMPRLLREVESMKAAADTLDGGSLRDAVHDAALEMLHVGELLCEHMQSEWAAGRRPAA